MTNQYLKTELIANEALVQLKNNLVMAKLVHRDYEETFAKEGETIRVRRPVQYTVRTGAVASAQDHKEGNVSITLNRMRGVDFAFSSTELTLDIERMSERYIAPAVMQLAHQVDSDLLGLYTNVSNWAWRKTNISDTARITALDDFFVAPERLDENAVPSPDRNGVLSPADYWGVVSALTGVNPERKALTAIERARIGDLGGVMTYSTQQVLTHTVGATGSTDTVNTSTAPVAYETVMGTTPLQQTLVMTGNAIVANRWLPGDVFTIADVYDVNPRTKQRINNRLKQFTVLAAANSASGTYNVTVSPALISSGAYKNVDVVSAGAGKGVTRVGTAATGYRQNMVFHKNAFALCVRPLDMPPGSVDGARATDPDTGLSVRVIPFYDGVNDISTYRLDILYGVAAIAPELATRLSASSA